MKGILKYPSIFLYGFSLSLFCASSVLASGIEDVKTEEVENDSEAEIYVVSDISEMVDLIDDNWDAYFSSAVLDTEQNTLTVDGIEADPEDVFGEDAANIDLLESVEAAEDYFDETAYETDVIGEGKLEISSPFQTKRIVVYADRLEEYYGAVSVLVYPKNDEYILEFDTPEDAQHAWSILERDYPNSCYVDEFLQDLLLEEEPGKVNWGYEQMGFQNVIESNSAVPSEDVRIAIIDTGIDPENPYFDEGRISGDSYDFVNNTTSLTDRVGHGTHIAGILADCTPENFELMMLKVFDDSGNATWLSINNALFYAIEHGADVINMSIGITSRLYPSNYTALDTALHDAWRMDIPVCAAAGNDGLNVSHVYPACSDVTIAVSAIGEALEFAELYPGTGGSGYGDGISFCAPGVNIYSASRTGGLVKKTGTSCSAAFVSAAFSIIKSQNGDVSVDELLEKAVALTVDLGEAGKDPYYGWGLIYFDAGTDEREPISLDDCEVSVSPLTVTYSGKPNKPKTEIEHKGTRLVEGEDFLVEYVNNINAGVGLVQITGMGAYRETIQRTFTIQKCSVGITVGNITRKYSKRKQTFDLKAKCTAPLVYRSDNPAVSVNEKGIATVKAGFVGKAGITLSVKDTSNYEKKTKQISITVNPTQTAIRSLKSQKNRQNAILKWNKNTTGSGYEIQYANDKDFKTGVRSLRFNNNKNTETIVKKLKRGKRYYFRIRTVKNVSRDKVVSSWSGKKTITIK